MKKLAFLLVCVFTLCATTMRADNERPIAVTDLPKTAQAFIKTHFADVPVMLAKVESGFLEGKEYKVMLRNGQVLDFYANGEWKEIDGRHYEVPTAIIPEFITRYIQEMWPDAKVLKLEKDKRNKEYEAELNNRFELTFTFDGKLVDVDD